MVSSDRSKVCTKCKELKPLGEFYQSKRHADGLTYWCKECVKLAKAKWVADNPERVREWAKRTPYVSQFKEVEDLRIPGVEYRDIPGFPGYMVGNDGTIWSFWKPGAAPGLASVPRRLKGKVHRSGHIDVTLQLNNRSLIKKAHQLVLFAFVGPKPDGMECRHLNGVPADNRLENLVWGTRKENVADAIQHGTFAPLGSRWRRCGKLASDHADEMKNMRLEGKTIKDVAEHFKVCMATVWRQTGSIRKERDLSRSCCDGMAGVVSA